MPLNLPNGLTVLALVVPSTPRQLLSHKGKKGDTIVKDQEYKWVIVGEA